MKEILKKINQESTLVEMVNETKLDQKRLEREIEELRLNKINIEEDLKATRADAA